MSTWFRRRRRIQTQKGRLLFPADWRELIWKFHPLSVTLTVALLVSFGVVHTLEAQMRPVLLNIAEVQTHNAITALLEKSIARGLEQQPFSYGEIVTIQRNENGDIAALTTDMVRMNRLRNQLLEELLDALGGLEDTTIQIPVGSLVDSELLWGRGPSIEVYSVAMGTVSAEFESEFSSAGVNQTLHKIWLSLSVPVKVLLPGAQLETQVDTRMCVAETVIVGQVPNYLQKAYQ